MSSSHAVVRFSKGYLSYHAALGSDITKVVGCKDDIPALHLPRTLLQLTGSGSSLTLAMPRGTLVIDLCLEILADQARRTDSRVHGMFNMQGMLGGAVFDARSYSVIKSSSQQSWACNQEENRSCCQKRDRSSTHDIYFVSQELFEENSEVEKLYKHLSPICTCKVLNNQCLQAKKT